jgi:predicted RNA-binding protein with PUA-like domain
MNYWFVKSPFRTRSWQDVLVKGIFKLYGIRNHQSKNNIGKMKIGDKAFFYHGPSGRQVYGVMQVVKKAYPDPTSNTTGWLSVDFEPVQTFDYPISLNQIRFIPEIENTSFIKQPRVTVSPLTKEEFEKIVTVALLRERHNECVA